MSTQRTSLGDLTTEGRNPDSIELDRLSALEIVRLMNAEDARVAPAVGECAEVIARAIDVIAERLRAGGRLIYIGAGTSGRLGVLDAAECPPTFQSPPWQVVGLIAGGPTALTRAVEGAEDHPELAVADLRDIDFSARDVIVGIATSGRTPYVVGGLEYARSLGASAIGVSCNDNSALQPVCDLAITPIVGPEVVTGSTRLKAGTATKLVLNMLTTGVMVRLGKTYGNLMVDLQATNQKLADRSARIVAAVTGLPSDEAETLLHRCGGDVKVACVADRRGVPTEEARRLLQLAGGRLRETFDLEDRLPPIATPSAATEFLLGIDGGGTKTIAWLAAAAVDSDEPLGIGESGSSNPQTMGWAAAVANIDLAISRAFAHAQQTRQSVTAACLAIAGTGREADRQRLELWAQQQRIADRLLTTHDALPVLAAGTSAMAGLAVISGTGSFAFGLNEQGKTARAGGWGYRLGDQGSGYAVATEGLRAVVQADDGTGPPTRLTDALLVELEVDRVADLRDHVYDARTDARTLAALAPLVLRVAASGDDVAQAILQQAAEELARLIAALARQLADGHRSEFELAMAGGTLAGSPTLREQLLARLVEDGVTISRHTLVERPVLGALRLARLAAESSDRVLKPSADLALRQFQNH